MYVRIYTLFCNSPIGSFAAASNITGALEDTESITRVLHKGGALAFWDYATAAPYVQIDMNPKGSSAADSVSRARQNEERRAAPSGWIM